MMQTIVERCCEVLRQGGTLLYPTDTIWGLGCDATNAEAINRIRSIKHRDPQKEMLVLALPEFCTVKDDEALRLLTSTGRPTTVVLPTALFAFGTARPPLYSGTSLGIRFPHHAFCEALLHAFGAPIVSTSANISGMPSPLRYEDISTDLLSAVDYAVPPLPLFASYETSGSRIVSIDDDGHITTLRP